MIRSEESGGFSSGSHSRHTESEESVVEDPVETYDIEEVVEPADTNPEHCWLKLFLMFSPFSLN